MRAPLRLRKRVRRGRENTGASGPRGRLDEARLSLARRRARHARLARRAPLRGDEHAAHHALG